MPCNYHNAKEIKQEILKCSTVNNYVRVNQNNFSKAQKFLSEGAM
jgi:hypothetical protein